MVSRAARTGRVPFLTVDAPTPTHDSTAELRAAWIHVHIFDILSKMLSPAIEAQHYYLRDRVSTGMSIATRGGCGPVQRDLGHEAVVIALLLGVMLLNFVTLWYTETILKHGLAVVLLVVGWVLAVLQASLAVQMVIASLRALGALTWPNS